MPTVGRFSFVVKTEMVPCGLITYIYFFMLQNYATFVPLAIPNLSDFEHIACESGLERVYAMSVWPHGGSLSAAKQEATPAGCSAYR